MSRMNSCVSYSRTSRISTGTTTHREQMRSKINSGQPLNRTRDMENFIIVWLNMSNQEFDPHSFEQLQKIVHSIKKFVNPHQCFEFLSTIKDEKIFLIISQLFEPERMSFLDDFPHLNSIYCHSDEKFVYQPLKKFKGVFKTIEKICDEIKSELSQSENDLTPISLISVSSIDRLAQLDQSFLYAEMVKKILLEISFDVEAKSRFVEFCRLQYAENPYEIDLIDEFDRTYPETTPIWWYTRDCFISSMLNKALRTQDTEVIVKMAFFISDLHQQIQQHYSQIDKTKKFFVYRGQGMLNLEFSQLLKNKAGFLSFNNFVSTFVDRQIPLNFAQRSRTNPHVTSVLFQIEIDPLKSSSSPFVLTNQLNFHPQTSNEILFSLHTIFRLEEIKQIDERLWQINLVLPSDNDEQIQRLLDFTGQVTREEIGIHRMAKLMLVIGQIEKAKEIYSALLKTTSEDDEKEMAYLHHQLGFIHEQQGNLNDALDHYEQSLDFLLCYLPFNDPQLCPTYSNIGLILKKQGNLDGALECFQQALEINLMNENSNYVEIAIRYNHIGGVFDVQRKFRQALENYQQALEIEQNHLSLDHPLIGATHNNIGLVYYAMKDYSSALIHFYRTLLIEEKSLSSDHPSLLLTHANLTGVYENLRDFDRAIEHSEKALDIVQKVFSFDHPQVRLWQEYVKQLREKQ